MKMYQTKFFAIFSLVIVLCACDNKHVPSEPEFSVSSINDYPFLYNDTQKGGIINFKSNEFEQCTFTFIQANFAQGYQYRISQSESGEIDLSCLNDEDLFGLNESEKTYAQVSIAIKNDNATVTLNFSLMGFNSEKLVVKRDIVLEINAQQLKTLQSN